MKQTFLEWLFDIHRAPAIIQQAAPRVPPTAIEIINQQLNNLANELDNLRCDDNGVLDQDKAYHGVLALFESLHGELIRRSQEESKKVNEAT
jgi:hypothetical protein